MLYLPSSLLRVSLRLTRYFLTMRFVEMSLKMLSMRVVVSLTGTSNLFCWTISSSFSSTCLSFSSCSSGFSSTIATWLTARKFLPVVVVFFCCDRL